MSINLIGEDVKLMRRRYDEALQMRGIPVLYQYPNLATSNTQGESVVDSFSDQIETHVFFDGNPKLKTFKRYGWVVENDKELPFLLHCSFNLPHLQKDAIFRISGQYSELPDRVFKVTELTYDMQAADHIICQVVPVYDTQVAGKTDVEVAKQYNKSNYFLKPASDYRGKPYVTQEDTGK